MPIPIHETSVTDIPRSAMRGSRSALRPRVALTTACSILSATLAPGRRRSGDSSQRTARWS